MNTETLLIEHKIITQNTIYRDYEDLFNYCIILSKKFYKIYKKRFQLRGLELEDLEQITKLVMFKQIKKLLNGTERLKLRNIARKYAVLMLVRLSNTEWADALKYIARPEIKEEIEKEIGDEENFSSNDLENTPYLVKLLDNVLVEKNSFKKPEFFIKDILKELKPKQRIIIEKYFLENKTLGAIGEELNLSRQRIQQIYKEAIKKIKNNPLLFRELSI